MVFSTTTTTATTPAASHSTRAIIIRTITRVLGRNEIHTAKQQSIIGQRFV